MIKQGGPMEILTFFDFFTLGTKSCYNNYSLKFMVTKEWVHEVSSICFNIVPRDDSGLFKERKAR